MSSILFVFSAILMAISANARCRDEASYTVTVTNAWTPANCGSIPPGAHLSPLVAFTHANRFTQFILYGYATPGVKNVCELGSTALLNTELMTMTTGVGEVAISRSPFGISAGESYSVSLTTTKEYPYISFITMLAPSTDWILGSTRIIMTNRKGCFKKMRMGSLKPYDCGTKEDNGVASSPQLNIAPLGDAFCEGNALGSYKIQRV